MQPPDLPPFLDRRNQKGSTMEPKAPKPRKAVLRLVVEFDHEDFNMEAVQEMVAKAREMGTIRTAKLTGLPTSSDLA